MRVRGPVFPGSAYAVPPVVNDPSAGSEPLPPLALKVITCVVGIHFALRVTDAVGMYVPDITVEVSIQPWKT